MTYVSHGFDGKSFEQFAENKDICKFRKWINAGSDMYGEGHPKGMRMLRGDTAEDITDYIIAGKRSLLESCKNKDKNSYDIMTIPNMPQLRTIRRIIGDTDFNAVDGQKFVDSIGWCGDFRMNKLGKHYQIPYSALYNSEFDNLLAVGRIISSPQGDGWEVARVIPVCAMTGEAAGNSAVLCIEDMCCVANVNIDKLQKLQGVD